MLTFASFGLVIPAFYRWARGEIRAGHQSRWRSRDPVHSLRGEPGVHAGDRQACGRQVRRQVRAKDVGTEPAEDEVEVGWSRNKALGSLAVPSRSAWGS